MQHNKGPSTSSPTAPPPQPTKKTYWEEFCPKEEFIKILKDTIPPSYRRNFCYDQSYEEMKVHMRRTEDFMAIFAKSLEGFELPLDPRTTPFEELSAAVCEKYGLTLDPTAEPHELEKWFRRDAPGAPSDSHQTEVADDSETIAELRAEQARLKADNASLRSSLDGILQQLTLTVTGKSTGRTQGPPRARKDDEGKKKGEI